MSGGVGFSLVFALVTLTLLAVIPIASAYVAAYLVAGTFSDALAAAVSGGIGPRVENVATICFGLGFLVAVVISLPTMLNMDWFVTLGSILGPVDRVVVARYRPGVFDVADRVSGALGWFGPAVGTGAVFALEAVAWPTVDGLALGRLLAGGSVPADWLTVFIPSVVRCGIGGVITVIAGLLWRSVAASDDAV